MLFGIFKSDKIAMANLNVLIFGLRENRVKFHYGEFSCKNSMEEWFHIQVSNKSDIILIKEYEYLVMAISS